MTALLQVRQASCGLQHLEGDNCVGLALLHNGRIHLVAVLYICNNGTASLAHSVDLAYLYVIALSKQDISQKA